VVVRVRDHVLEGADGAVGEDEPGAAVSLCPFERLGADLRGADAGVDHDRQPALVGQREHVVEPLVVHGEALAARVQLEPDGAAVEASLGLCERILGRVQPAERAEPVRVGVHELEHVGVRLTVSRRFLEREHQRAGVDLLERVDGLLGGGQQARGVAQADVDMGVVDLQVRHVVVDGRHPGHQVRLRIHPLRLPGSRVRPTVLSAIALLAARTGCHRAAWG
jgi:hypothetical protein